MTEINEPTAQSGSTLLREWQATSVQTVWLRPGDWYTPAVEALAEALDAGLDTAAAATRLGKARADAGIGITESIDDMAVVFRAAGYEYAPSRSVRALCAGWTEGGQAHSIVGNMTDAESGLGTPEYLAQRLAEVYGVAQRSGMRVSDTHALVMIDVTVVDSDVWQRMARNAAVGSALKSAYGEGHPMARVTDGIYAVLVERGESLGSGIAGLREQLTERANTMRVDNLMRQPPRVWVEALPASQVYAVELLDSMQR